MNEKTPFPREGVATARAATIKFRRPQFLPLAGDDSFDLSRVLIAPDRPAYCYDLSIPAKYERVSYDDISPSVRAAALKAFVDVTTESVLLKALGAYEPQPPMTRRERFGYWIEKWRDRLHLARRALRGDDLEERDW